MSNYVSDCNCNGCHGAHVSHLRSQVEALETKLAALTEAGEFLADCVADGLAVEDELLDAALARWNEVVK